MTLQYFIAVWQAQPFRAFRIHTSRGVITVTYPLATALTADMRVVGISDQGRCEIFALDEVTRFEIFGKELSIADAINAIAPEILARNSQLLVKAMEPDKSAASETESLASRADPGQIKLASLILKNGVHVVEASVSGKEGGPIFATAGTRWNLHGIEQFENGTSLYLHHLDHPAVEQRVILWPPNTGSFDSFGEAEPFGELMKELAKRDERLAKKPAKIEELPAAYFRKILPEYPVVDPDSRIDGFGDELPKDDFDRFEIHLVPRTLSDGIIVNNPCLVDVPAENFMFNLTETDWDATFTRGTETITLVLSHPRQAGRLITLVIDPYLLNATIRGVGEALPLGFIERDLRNFALYENWDLLIGALRNGPDRLKQPDLVIPLAEGFVAEMWAGETRFPLPFLQPRILDPHGAPVLDFQATPWAAAIFVDAKKPAVTLCLLSHERENRCAPAGYDLKLDLMTHRVTCAGFEGSTTIGMIQAMIRHARGVKWLGEQLTEWFAKGRALPVP